MTYLIATFVAINPPPGRNRGTPGWAFGELSLTDATSNAGDLTGGCDCALLKGEMDVGSADTMVQNTMPAAISRNFSRKRDAGLRRRFPFPNVTPEKSQNFG